MRWRKHTNQITGFLVVLPSIVLIGVFVYGFNRPGDLVSLTDLGEGPGQALALKPVTRSFGLENYRELFTGLTTPGSGQDMVSTVSSPVLPRRLPPSRAPPRDRHRPQAEGRVLRGVFLFPFALSF